MKPLLVAAIVAAAVLSGGRVGAQSPKVDELIPKGTGEFRGKATYGVPPL